MWRRSSCSCTRAAPRRRRQRRRRRGSRSTAASTRPGALPAIVEAMDDEIDVVVTGHTNWAVNCIIDGKIVTGAARRAGSITDIDLTISRRDEGRRRRDTVNNHIVTRRRPEGARADGADRRSTTVRRPDRQPRDRPIDGAILRANNAAGESALGDVIADAQLAATHAGRLGGAVVAFMNPGGIRADSSSTRSRAASARPGHLRRGRSPCSRSATRGRR